MSQRLRCIAFVSPLGGSGQTTVVANLASLWRASGEPCLAVDLCAQNSLGLHLGRPLAEPQKYPPVAGWAASVQADRWWAEAALENTDQVQFLPFGSAGDQPLLAKLNQTLAQDPLWLLSQLQGTELADNSLVLLDAPAWPQPLAYQALRCADLVVVCLDTSARAPQLQAQAQALLAQAPPDARKALLATRFNPRRASQRQALDSLQQQWTDRLAPYVLHDDESVPVALAAAHCVTMHAPQSQSAHDLNGIAHWLLAQCQSGEPGP
jgi:cellulose synthase operon protein YhjQ